MANETREIDGVELPPKGTFEFDRAHTSIEFIARHMISKVRGRFTEFDGKIVVGEGLGDSSVEVEIQAASITTDTEMRDNHLRSGDFLLTEEFPTLTFASTALRPTGGNTFALDGYLTIKGISNPVTLEAEFVGWGPNPESKPMVVFSAKTTIVREDWDITWNMAAETGGFLVGKKVDIEINVEAIKVD